jgi:hypothetical protein
VFVDEGRWRAISTTPTANRSPVDAARMGAIQVTWLCLPGCPGASAQLAQMVVVSTMISCSLARMISGETDLDFSD